MLPQLPMAAPPSSLMVRTREADCSNCLVSSISSEVSASYSSDDAAQDHGATLSSTTSPTAVRLIIALATFLRYELYSLHITGAFLHAEIDVDTYEKLSEVLTKYGCVPDVNESQTWVYRNGPDHLLLTAHVDDIIVAASSESAFQRFVSFLGTDGELEVGSSGKVSLFLGCSIEQHLDEDYTIIHQRGYIDTFVGKYAANCHPASNPLASTVSATFFDPSSPPCTPAEHTTYRGIVGGLLWLSSWTRPDLAYAATFLSRQLQSPTHNQLTVALQVLSYLKRTASVGLRYDRKTTACLPCDLSIPALVGYVDASYADKEPPCKSTTGYVIVFGGAAISWRSKRQDIISQSSAESEFIAGSSAGNEIKFLRMLLDHLGFPQRWPTVLYEDNNACIDMSNDPAHRARTRHIDLRRYKLKEYVQRQVLILMRKDTKDQHADFLTKILTGPTFHYHYSAINSGIDALSRS
jgi:hypothetical protein